MKSLSVKLPSEGEGRAVNGKSLIQIHVFYTDLLPEFYGHLKGITVPYDLFISTDTAEKKQEIETFFYINKLSAGKIEVETFENRGRDVYPFLSQVHNRIGSYDYVAHFHTKKTLHSDMGDFWRKSLLKTLLGGGARYDAAASYLEKNHDCGLLIPFVPKNRSLYWGYARTKIDKWNENTVSELLDSFSCRGSGYSTVDYEHPAGTMFIGRMMAVRQVFEHEFSAADYPDEEGQVEHTLQHALELVWHPVCVANGYRIGVV